MAHEPAYRGTMVSTVVRMMDDDSEILEAVEQQLPQPILHRMRTSTRLAWLPAEPFDLLKQAHFEHVGLERYVAFWRRYMTQVAVNPLFRNLLEGGKRIFGGAPSGVIKWMPKGWGLSTRGCGTFSADITETTATLTLEDAPPSSRQSSTGHTSKGTILGLCDLLSIEGTVEVDDSGMNEGRFVMHARWA